MSSEQQREPPSPPTRRELFEGRLQPPSKPPSAKSYTIAPASINEVVVRRQNERQAARDPVEISSAATAQPFVDPAVLEHRRRISDPD
ncbi:uncharacterized protein F4822DRAFT_140266 [Hypoxylon trugodes]|uniref:uncharacterized protein n=1 Tax=Hypoxylon trugodes TaxID=326681 RepID=UPI00219274DC|nr:uncharacterized protein F4822DRAFT_140266 [Hypoxylon trugodes]KAI1392773.1 hypothetical protein F4822DRAFT_140266 [Hypoxylon trugodes]